MTSFSAMLALELLRDENKLPHRVQQSPAYISRYSNTSNPTIPPLKRFIELCELQSFVDLNGKLNPQDPNTCATTTTDYAYWGIQKPQDALDWQRAETEYLCKNVAVFAPLVEELEVARTLDPEKLAEWMRDPSKQDYLVVDVRDEDFQSGHISKAINVPSKDFHKDSSNYATLLETPKKIIFHCALSQVRGPKAANAYLKEVVEATGSKQEVYVLQGGFTKWQSRYGKDESLTQDYDEELWKNKN
ncbi:hypothetical protein HDU81_003957 [Chytriomyces hyalinus]|nr:hypothetical protein HDU81_003957 [Chytriomyces hyalinus]